MEGGTAEGSGLTCSWTGSCSGRRRRGRARYRSDADGATFRSKSPCSVCASSSALAIAWNETKRNVNDFLWDREHIRALDSPDEIDEQVRGGDREKLQLNQERKLVQKHLDLVLD